MLHHTFQYSSLTLDYRRLGRCDCHSLFLGTNCKQEHTTLSRTKINTNSVLRFLYSLKSLKHITEIKAEHLVKDYVKSAIVDAGKQLNTSAVTWFLRAFWGFSPITKLLGRTEMQTCERNHDRRYEQLEISPETIKQELRRVVCKQRQTDRHI